MLIHELLSKHNFQFVSFCAIRRQAPEECRDGLVQVNDDAHLIHVLRGERRMRLGEREYCLRRGSVIAVPLFTAFTLSRPAGPFDMLNIHYRITTEDKVPLERMAALPVHFRARDMDWLTERLERMERLNTSGDVAMLPLLAAEAHAVVLHHLTRVPLRSPMSIQQDARMRAVHTRLTDPAFQRFDAAELAAVCHLSVSQMNRRFTAAFRASPHRYWERHRFSRIAAALRQWDRADGLDALAERFGFADTAYFVRWFKKMSGHPPLRYRRQLSEESAPL